MFIIKVSSKLPRKHSPRCGSPNLSRQGVPGCRPCHSECTVCQSCPCPDHSEVPTLSGSQTIVVAGVTQFCQVGRCYAMENVIH